MNITRMATASEPVLDRSALPIPVWFRQQFDAAVRDGVTLGQRIASTTPQTDQRIIDQAVHGIGSVPSDAETQLELQQLHQIASARTPAGSDAARWHAQFGTTLLWNAPRHDLGRLGADDARTATKLLDHVLSVVHEANHQAKSHFDRRRPFERDSSLSTVVDRPYGDGSFPSGHASAALANALVLGAFLTGQAQTLTNDAAQVAWSRLYGGVHYLTDVLASARLGASIATAISLTTQHPGG